MPVVPRQQHDVACAKVQRWFVFYRHAQRTGDYVVERDDVPGIEQVRPAFFRLDVGKNAPRRGELGIEEHAAGEADDADQIRQCVHRQVASGARDPAARSFLRQGALPRVAAIEFKERPMLLRDSIGNHYSGATPTSIEHFEHGLRLLQCYIGDPVSTADAALAEAPDMIMAHALRAWLLLLSTEAPATVRGTCLVGSRLTIACHRARARPSGGHRAPP